MRITPSYDEQLRKSLLAEFGGDTEKADELTRGYQSAFAKLKKEVYPYIRATEPDLTDHGQDHVRTVLRNLMELLSDDGMIKTLTGIELYFLGMLVLFHDVGNLYGRENHHQNVSQVFDDVRGTSPSIRREKTLIVRAARAHTGLAADGTPDTLQDLPIDEQLEGRKVRFQQMAAILRFADELAEGPERTSHFMREQGLFATESEIYHEYSAATNVLIDRPGRRIVLTYEVAVQKEGGRDERTSKLLTFLKFVFDRIGKLDQERRYARFYAELLEPFRMTEVRFNFHCGDRVLETDLEPIRLNDKIVPGEQDFDPAEIDPSYSLDRLVRCLIAKCLEEANHDT